jgi:hypothetical protein
MAGLTPPPRQDAADRTNPPGESMAASNSSDDLPSSPEPRPERARLARPATAPSRPPAGERPAGGERRAAAAPGLPRPFVPPGAQAAPRASRPAHALPPADSEVARPRDAAADAQQDRPTQPVDAIDATPAVLGEHGWQPSAEPATAAERAALDALAGESGAPTPSRIPGADARPRPATPAVPVGALPVDAPAPEADTAAETEWLAMRELGAAAPPAADAAVDVRTGQSDVPRGGYADLSPTVVPPAEAWPEDVWSEDTATAPEPGAVSVDDLPHPVAFGNDVVPAADDDPTLGSLSAEPLATVYPPAVPDALDAYALDGNVADANPPSAVYTPDRAHEWTVSAGGVAGEQGMPVPPPSARSDVVEPSQPASGGMSARLRSLAAEVENRALELPAIPPEMRDSEALVVLLAAVLRRGR